MKLQWGLAIDGLVKVAFGVFSWGDALGVLVENGLDCGNQLRGDVFGFDSEHVIPQVLNGGFPFPLVS